MDWRVDTDASLFIVTCTSAHHGDHQIIAIASVSMVDAVHVVTATIWHGCVLMQTDEMLLD